MCCVCSVLCVLVMFCQVKAQVEKVQKEKKMEDGSQLEFDCFKQCKWQLLVLCFFLLVLLLRLMMLWLLFCCCQGPAKEEGIKRLIEDLSKKALL